VPHNLNAAQKRALEILSRHVMTQLELRRRSRELAQANAEQKKMQRTMNEFQTELLRVRNQLARQAAKPPARAKLKKVKKTGRH